MDRSNVDRTPIAKRTMFLIDPTPLTEQINRMRSGRPA